MSFSLYILLFRHHTKGRKWAPDLKADKLDICQWFQSNSLCDNQSILGMYKHIYKSINCVCSFNAKLFILMVPILSVLL